MALTSVGQYPKFENDLRLQNLLLNQRDEYMQRLNHWKTFPTDHAMRDGQIEVDERVLVDIYRKYSDLTADMDTKRRVWADAKSDLDEYDTTLWYEEQLKLWQNMDQDTDKARRFKQKWLDPAKSDVEALAVMKEQKRVAIMMGLHERLGDKSFFRRLNPEVAKYIHNYI